MKRTVILASICILASLACGQGLVIPRNAGTRLAAIEEWQNAFVTTNLTVAGNITGTDDKAAVVAAGTHAAVVDYRGAVRQTVVTITCNGTKCQSLPDGDKGGGTNVFTFPEGRILILSAACDLVVTNTGNFSASDDDHYYVAIGTADAGNDNDLTGTEADIIAKTTIDTAAGVTLSTDLEADMTAGADSVWDGTASAVGVYVNTAIEATDNSGNNFIGITGTLRITWAWLGDD